MNCIVCEGKQKYKCSKCRAPYCSVGCYQQHKEGCPGAVAKEENTHSKNIIV
jgi:hypothetical protein